MNNTIMILKPADAFYHTGLGIKICRILEKKHWKPEKSVFLSCPQQHE